MNTTTTTTASQRGTDWLVNQMNDDGSIRGGRSINEYYKTVFGLCCAGRGAEADRMLDYIAARFVRDDGDLDGTGCEWFDLFPLYPHAWIIMAGVMRARLDLVARVGEFLSRFQDKSTGGFFTTTADHDRRGGQDMMTTGLAGIALLWAGQVDVARGVARWMRELWHAQPNPAEKLFFVWDGRNGLVRDFAADDAKSFVVDSTCEAQRYYQFGIPCAFLTQFAGVTAGQQAEWHDLAGRYLHATQHYHHDVYQRPQSGKVGWGAAWRCRALRQAPDLNIVQQVYENLSAAQHPEGWWSATNVYRPQHQSSAHATGQQLPPQPGIDLTGEFVAHLCWMESVLAGAGTTLRRAITAMPAS